MLRGPVNTCLRSEGETRALINLGVQNFLREFAQAQTLKHTRLLVASLRVLLVCWLCLNL